MPSIASTPFWSTRLQRRHAVTTTRDDPCLVTIPTHLVLHARFDVTRLTVGTSYSLRQALQLGEVFTLSEEDHLAAIEELRERAK